MLAGAPEQHVPVPQQLGQHTQGGDEEQEGVAGAVGEGHEDHSEQIAPLEAGGEVGAGKGGVELQLRQGVGQAALGGREGGGWVFVLY